MRSRLPNFRGQRCLVLHRRDNNSDTLVRQLESLGLIVDLRWPVEGATADGYDVMFFDADLGYDGLFAWPPAPPPIPLIAMMGSEAPGRIEWMLSQAPAAYLIKPIGSTGVFSALAIAFHSFETEQGLKGAITDLTLRVKSRPLVFKAMLALMDQLGIDDDEAYRLLRRESMNRRITVEALSELIATKRYAQLGGLDIRNRRTSR